ncbi:MAG TPA: ACP S-malonyltransferase [Burkholderiales bacterium]|nr:ACP S-malonyltransferase [Burkholderiales bacterium]
MKFAFVFPGQGSQSVGMMRGFADLPVVRQTFDEASGILNQDLWTLVENGPETALSQTVNTQPVMLIAGIAVYRAWRKLGGAAPHLLAGHSLAEYTALVAGGALDFAEALPLVRFRAETMQQAVPEGMGGIAAILGLDEIKIKEICLEAAQGEVLEAVNFNSPGQIVVAGHRTAVLRGMELAKTKGAKRAIMLPMSAPSHCSLMRGAAVKLKERLQSAAIKPPQIPVVHNVDVSEHAEPDAIKEALVRQLYNPVRWVETIRALAQRGVTHVAECAPGGVLAGLNKRIAPAQEVFAFNDGAALKQALAVLA